MTADNERCEQGAALFPGPRPLDEDHPLMLAQKEDLQALGGVFLELIFSSLGSAGPSDSTSGPALQRLLVDVFKGNIDEFRCVVARIKRRSGRSAVKSELAVEQHHAIMLLLL